MKGAPGTAHDEIRARSACLLAIVTPLYFKSPDTKSDWASFESGQPRRPVLPVLLRGAREAMPELSRVTHDDFREFALIGEGFQKSERCVEFQLRIQHLAEAVGGLLSERSAIGSRQS
jgi:hypothetical protein